MPTALALCTNVLNTIRSVQNSKFNMNYYMRTEEAPDCSIEDMLELHEHKELTRHAAPTCNTSFCIMGWAIIILAQQGYKGPMDGHSVAQLMGLPFFGEVFFNNEAHALQALERHTNRLYLIEQEKKDAQRHAEHSQRAD